MGAVLFLFDTTERDFARDFGDLLAELGIKATMIPTLASKGKTLQEKEEKYFESADGAIFLITPGSERMGKWFPSPSVADEMGQAKQRFKKHPEKVIYLVDSNCNIQAIDQKAYIPFNRNDIRTVLGALTLLIRELKEIGIFGKKEIQPRETPGINIGEYSKSISDTLKEICFDLSDQPNGFMGATDFDSLLKSKYRQGNRSINFIKRDLQEKGLVQFHPPNFEKMPYFYGGWQLSNLGFELVRYDINRTKPIPPRPAVNELAKLFNKPSALTVKPKALSDLVKRENKKGLLSLSDLAKLRKEQE